MGNVKICHHVVYSVKGGSGKTTFSLFLLLSDYLRDWNGKFDDNKMKEVAAKDYFYAGDASENGRSDSEPEEDRKNQSEPTKEEIAATKTVCYCFDMDFLGTSLLENIGGDDEYLRMNDIIFDEGDVTDLYSVPEYKNRVAGREERYIIPSSQREADKERFHVKSKNTPLLKYDEFRHEIGAVVSKIRLYEGVRAMLDDENAARRVNFIYDLPPNADGYTEALFDYLLDCRKKDEPVVLYLVFNNSTTLTANLEWLDRFSATGRKVDFKISYVNNEIVGKERQTELKISQPDFNSVDGMLQQKNHLEKRFICNYVDSSFSVDVMRLNYNNSVKGMELGNKVELKNLFVK